MAKTDFDVVIMGGGAAGISAAIEALEAGARVLLCEKARRVGGSASSSGGIILAAGTDVQRARGVEDCVDDFYEHYMTHNKYMVEPQLARLLCEGGQPTLDWLRSYGVTFDPANLYLAGIENCKAPRGHAADGYGLAIMGALECAAMARGLEVATRTSVDAVLRNSAGTVCGICAGGMDITSTAVIIASGGFGNNFDLLEQYYPMVAKHGKDWHFYIGVDENVGDGLQLAQAVGAAIVGEGLGNAAVTARFSKEPEPYIPGWLIYVNDRGFRFADETASYVIKDHIVDQQPGSHCWALMDHAAFMRDDNDPKYRTSQFLSFPTPNWQPDVLRRHKEGGMIQCGETLEELGRKIGIVAEAMAATVAEYNMNADAGVDPHYRKAHPYLIPVTKPPFYAIELRPAGVGTTHAGIRIDGKARVYDRSGKTMRGLFAAGECTGGLMAHYVGGGNSLLVSFVFGRIAGRGAATLALG